ncbi:MAG: CofH family radical SAM protein [Thermoproteota archaeon]|nr:CofH family radical SAM protein [Thermoproteota archaeon]
MQNIQYIDNTLKNTELQDTINNIVRNDDININNLLELLETNDIHYLGLVGNYLRESAFGKNVTFINNIILNYTNVCITYCKFCAFYRPPGHDESYTVSKDEILDRIIFAKSNYDIKQVLFQGGHNPKLKIEYFEDIFREIKNRCPDVAIHGLSASEIDMIAKVERSTTKEVLSRLKEAGLDSLPGAGAEILEDDVKKTISPLKINSDTWLRIMEESHGLNIPSSATMMYGTVETTEQRARHLLKILNLQRKTKGFMAFIPWSFEPNKTEMQNSGVVQYPLGGVELLKMISISRIIYNGQINHLQSSWLTNGIGMAQLAIYHGSDDFGGTLIGEEVVSATGARSTELLSKNIINSIKAMGYNAAERDNSYKIIKYF